ncbi:MAG: phage tail tape measure protein, partial [Muribaculaceae bacterium]|nr:phage tail tape measure protein [Muribaculaceae bacterium]
IRTNAANVAEAMKRLGELSPKELRQTIRQINSELDSGRIPRGSEQWSEYTQKLALVKEELRRVNAELQAGGEAEKGLFDGIARWGQKWVGAYTIIDNVLSKLGLDFQKMRENFEAKEESQANLKALTGLDDGAIQWLTEQAGKLSTTMDETGLRITQSSREILDAYMMVGSNKPELLGSSEALNAVTVEAMRLASAAKMELGPAVDAMTTALNQYGQGADQAARFVNVLAAGSKSGASNVEQQAASILKAGTAAASANVTFEELVGAIEMLGEKGIKGEVAGTGLKKLFLVLQTGAKETNPKVVGLNTALENLNAMVERAEKKKVGGGASFLKDMFGEEAYSIASILASNTEAVRDYTAAVTDTQTAMEQAATNSDTTAAKMAQMRNRAEEAGNELMETLNPAIGFLAQVAGKSVGVIPVVVKALADCRG